MTNLENLDTIKYFVYARKSEAAEDRQALSIPAQLSTSEEAAKKFSLNSIHIFKESMSAKSPGRPIFNEMITRIENGEAQGIICWKLDRLARNPIDGGRINWLLQQGIIKHIKTPERDYYPGDNVLLMNMEFGVANQFIIDLRRNTIRGLMQKVKMGWLPGAKPGYLPDKLSEQGDKKLLPDTARLPLIKKAFELILTQKYTVAQVLDKMNNEWGYLTPKTKRQGGRPMAESTIYRILADPFYFGKFQYRGEWYKGAHETIITEDDFWRVQEILGRKGKSRPKTHNFAFTGLIRCGECGSMITAEEKFKKQKNGNAHHYTYYRCGKGKNVCPKCSQKTLEIKELEKQVDAYLEKIQIPEDFKNWAIKWLNNLNDGEIKEREIIRATQQKAYDNVEKKLDSLLSMRISELINDAEYTERKNKLLQEREKMAEQLKNYESRADNWRENVEKTFEFSCYARHWFKNGDLDTKKTILISLGSGFILKDRQLSLNLQKPFEIVKTGLEEIKTLEPVQIGLISKTKHSSVKKSALWGGYRDLNPNRDFHRVEC